MAEQRRGQWFGDALKGAAIAGPFGLLLGPMVFKDARQKREQENAMLRDSIDAQHELTDLLGNQVPVTTQGQGQRINEFLPEAGQQGMQPGMTLPGKRNTQMVPEVATPQGQMKVMQMLSRMSPEGAFKVAESLIPGSTTRATAAMKEMQQFGYPMTQEGFQQYNKDKGGSASPIESLLLSMQLQREQDAAAEREREASQEATELDREEKSFRNNLQVSGDSLMELARVNERLMGREGVSGALSRPGLPFAELRRDIASSFDESVAADIDTFNSLTNQIAISRLDTEGFDGSTNARFKAFTSTKPSFEAVGDANYMTIMNNLQGVLLADEAQGYTLPDFTRQKYEREVNRLRSLTGRQGDLRSVTLPNGDIVHNVPSTTTDEQLYKMMGY